MKRFYNLTSAVLLAILMFSCTSTPKDSVIIKLLPVNNGKAYKYIDAKGKSVIIPKFKEAGIFRNGLALVQLFGNKKVWGYINEEGNFQLPSRYKEATVFNEELAWVVSDNGAPVAINMKGDSLFTMKEAQSVRIFKNGLAAYSICTDSMNVKWGFVDTKGVIRILPQYPAAGNFSSGKCAVTNSAGEWGYIDEEGKVLINYQFTNARAFIHGKAIVQSGKEWGVIDENGKFVINPIFSEMNADNEQYIIKQNNKWGWCNKTGKIIIQPQFALAYPFNMNELAPVKSGNKFGFINKKGKLIIDAQFDAALPFNGEMAWVVSAGKGGFIDKNAKYIVEPQYLAVSEDFKDYLLTTSSAFESVNTDYFDVEAITFRLKKDITQNTVAGIDFRTPLSQIIVKFKKTDADFIKNASEHKIISAERISNDATLDFFILGTPWVEKYNGKLGFSYTLKADYKHSGFSYRLNLTKKGLGKEDVVLKSLEKAFVGYMKDEKHSTENVIILQNKIQLLICLKQPGNVIVAIYPETQENIQMVELNYGDSIETNSTNVVSDSASIK